jgi:hypothetical protein
LPAQQAVNVALTAILGSLRTAFVLRGLGGGGDQAAALAARAKPIATSGRKQD